jgi:hypothetical protein
MKNPRDSSWIVSFFDAQMLLCSSDELGKEVSCRDQLHVTDLRFFDDQNWLDFYRTRALIGSLCEQFHNQKHGCTFGSRYWCVWQ